MLKDPVEKGNSKNKWGISTESKLEVKWEWQKLKEKVTALKNAFKELSLKIAEEDNQNWKLASTIIKKLIIKKKENRVSKGWNEIKK